MDTNEKSKLNRTAIRPIAAVSLTLLLAVASTGYASPEAPAEASTRPTAIEVDANVAINKNSLDLHGPVSDFNVSLANGSGSKLDASIVDEGTAAEFTIDYADSENAILDASVEDDVTVKIVEDDEGEQSVQMSDSNGEIVGGILIEDAHTSDGTPVRAELSADGKTISQKFLIGNEEVEEPITVKAYASTVLYNKGWVTKKSSKKYIVNLDPTKLGRKQNALNTHKTHVKHTKKVLGSSNTKKYWNYNIEQQFLCHVVGAWFPTGVYNMESWQPTKKWQQIANPFDRCNRSKK